MSEALAALTKLVKVVMSYRPDQKKNKLGKAKNPKPQSRMPTKKYRAR
jgi:hypothetical protein